jgi:hypothetical protein
MRCARSLIVFVCVVVNSASAAEFAVDGRPESVAVADVDGDGKIDIAIGSDNSIIVIGRSSIVGATLEMKQSVKLATPGEQQCLVIADVSGDGKMDIISGDTGSNIYVQVRNSADGAALTFETVQILTPAGPPFQIFVIDINGDGKLDIISSSFSTDNISAFTRSSADGAALTFDPIQNFSVGTGPKGLAVFDVDSDGKADFVAADTVVGNMNLTIRTRTSADGAALSFSSAFNLVPPGDANLATLVVADADGDGKPDILLTRNTTSVILFLRTSANGASLQYSSPALEFPSALGANAALTTGDVDGDGKSDVVTANSTSKSASVTFLKRQSADGAALNYSSGALFAVGATPTGVALGDIDGDGQNDIVTANSDARSVSVITEDDRNGRPGQAGPTGLQGPSGPAGAVGPQGSVGLTGATGATGPKGDTGDTGSMGVEGQQGPAGPAGGGATPPLPAGAFILLPLGTPAPDGYFLMGNTKIRVKGVNGKNTNITMDVYQQK